MRQHTHEPVSPCRFLSSGRRRGLHGADGRPVTVRAPRDPHVLQQTLTDLDRACRDHGTFKVRWRSEARRSPSFRFPAGNLITVERLGRK